MANGLTKPAYRFDTLRLQAGYEPSAHNWAVSPPIYQTAAFDFRDVEHAEALFSLREVGNLYSRVGNPTVTALEQRVAALDGASGAVALSSGMAAISYTLLNVAEGGGRILASPTSTGGVRTASRRSISSSGSPSTWPGTSKTRPNWPPRSGPIPKVSSWRASAIPTRCSWILTPSPRLPMPTGSR